MSDIRVGVDIGGTFTDVVLVDFDRRHIRIGKTLTTPTDLIEGVLRGLALVTGDGHDELPSLSALMHGTTVVTNALIERKGANVGVLCGRGMRDVIEIGREFRYDIYDLTIQRPGPLAPRYLRREIDGRIGPDGRVLADIDLEQVDAQLRKLVADGAQGLAVSLMHSYANPVHEQQVAARIRETFPKLPITVSHELVPETREFERTSTTVANAYVQPVIQRYLESLVDELGERGLQSPIYMMLSSGGLATVQDASAAPVKMIESGPAGGALAARYIGKLVGESDLLSFDMGGTTAKLCLVSDGELLVAHEFETARIDRFKKGSGVPLRVPVIEMIEIGAGGGSIARIDAMGLVRIGPDSAGAEPGPASYGRGGDRPTVTDADLILGYLDPGYFLGGEMDLDKPAAGSAVASHLATPLDQPIVESAVAISEVVNENMAQATRLHAAERNRDVRKFAMIAFGGAGPVHAFRLAQMLGIRRVIYPYRAGILSALGFLVAPKRFDLMRSYFARIDDVDWDRLTQIYKTMEAEGAAALSEIGVEPSDMRFIPTADMRLAGQGFEVSVPIEPRVLDERDAVGLRTCFDTAYSALFDRVPDGVAVEALTWRLVATGPEPVLELELPEQTGEPESAKKAERPVYFPAQGGFVTTPVYDRAALRPGTALDGPAVLEEAESTVVVGPGARITVDPYLNVVVDLGAAEEA